MRIVFFLLIAFLSGTKVAFPQCDSIFLGNDTTLCEGLTLELDAGSGYASYTWSDGSEGQFLTVEEPGIYWCEVEYLDSANLVVNGDFSSGDVSFSTDYVWGIGGPWGILSEEGTYVIDENASFTHVNFAPCVDHTTGDGLFMIINGDTVQGENVWCQTVEVEPDAEYYFSGWFTSVNPANPAVLNYYINGQVIETVYLTGTTCLWQNFIKEWNAEDNATAEICIINQNTELGGNDFGIDDIHLLKTCRLSDTIQVSFEPAPEVDLGNDTVVCAGESVELSAGSGFSAYLWSNGSGDSTLMTDLPGFYWVKVTSITGCIGGDTILVDFAQIVSVDLGNDTAFCSGSGVMLDAGEGFSSYLWSNGTTTQTNQISSPGTYWVEVQDVNGCTGSDTIQVSLSPAVTVSLGGDTTVCTGDNYVLFPGAGFTSYMWQDGSTGSSFPVDVAGVYWVSVTDSYGCAGSDTVSVNISPSPQVSLGSDTVICSGSSLLLDPGSQYASYMWQDNSSFPVYTVTNTGYYSVTVTNIYNCPASAEVYVNVTSPDIGLGPDTLLCEGDTLYLDPGQGYDSYLWQDNSANPVYAVTLGGDYAVLVTDSYNCSTQANITVSTLAKPQAGLGGDQDLCTGSVLILETQAGAFTYYWNGEPGSNVYEVNKGGAYQLEVVNQCGSSTDQVTVTEYAVPQVDLGPDQVLQEGEELELDAGSGFDEYLWHDGSTGQYYGVISSEVSGNPDYWVEVWEGSCKNSDTVMIEVFRVKIPNVITPNGDGVNDTFTPMDDSWSGITSHHMEVFNRWGEKVWETDDFESGWDGKRKGTPVADGTYFWVLETVYGDQGTSRTYKGTVSVIGSSD